MARRDQTTPAKSKASRLSSRQVDDSGASGAADGARLVPGAAEAERDVEHTAAALFSDDERREALGPDYGHRRHRLRKDEEVSVYAEEMDRRYGVDARGKHMVALAVTLVVALAAALLLPQAFFGVLKSPSVATFLSGIQTNVSGLLSYFSGEAPYDPMRYKLFRYLVVAIAGAALGISGGVYQGALKNALASPTTLGVISGGTLGAMLFVIFGSEEQAETVVQTGSQMIEYLDSLSPLEHLAVYYGQAAWTLLGCFVVVVFVVAVSTLAGKGSISGIVLIITGQVVGIVTNAAMTLVRTYFVSTGDALKSAALQQVRSDSLSGLFTELDLVLMGVPILAGVAVIIAMRMRLNALTFSDDEARSMGLSTTATRYVMVGACTLMTALVIAFCGPIGFVGFVVPHLTRRVVGPDFKYYIPATALVGALFLVVTVFASSFFSLEQFGGTRLLTSIIGGAAFIVIALRGRNRMTADGF